MTRRLRIAILAHSTNPRGGVVHALELGDALCRLGYDATVHAPDAGTLELRHLVDSAVTSRANGARNPYAQHRTPCTAEDLLALLHSDGGMPLRRFLRALAAGETEEVPTLGFLGAAADVAREGLDVPLLLKTPVAQAAALVLRRYPAPKPELEGIAVRLDVEPRQ